MNITFQVPSFEGPLALLLYLIRKEEMDILNIPIHRITEQYMRHIQLMKELDLEVAGEFVSMAATLLHIKSRMLLPHYNEDGEIVDIEDPRKELVNRLLEYERFQQVSRELYERPLLGRDYWVRGISEKEEHTIKPADEIIIEDNALYQLILSYRKILRSATKRVHQVSNKIQSIASRIIEIKPFLQIGKRLGLQELITSADQKRRQVLITFLSLLELGKLGFVRLFQADPDQEIWIESLKELREDAIANVEDYESMPGLFDLGTSLVPTETRQEETVIESAGTAPVDENLSEEGFSVVQLAFAEAQESEIASDSEIEQAEMELGLQIPPMQVSGLVSGEGETV